ncbi:MAG: Atg14 domain-containing protein [Actinomycetota bacterium]|nr:Atg14 domain-containing protein [Actinomycetota bacterium]
MGAIQTLINALVVGVVGLILARMTHNLRLEVKGQVEGVESRLGDLRTELRGEIAEPRAEIREVRSDLTRVALRGDVAELRAEIREVRSDLTRVALAVGAEPRAGRQQS